MDSFTVCLLLRHPLLAALVDHCSPSNVPLLLVFLDPAFPMLTRHGITIAGLLILFYISLYLFAFAWKRKCFRVSVACEYVE